MLDAIGKRVRSVLEGMLEPRVAERLRRLEARVNEFGVDPFGLDPDAVRLAVPLIYLLYHHYFRVQTFGIQQVPDRGRVLLVGNHSGQLPWDAMMTISSMVLEHDPPRMVRSMVETWVPTLPFVSYMFPRWGQIVGTRENCLRLLESDEAILVFPEGVRGISKPYVKRYQLQEFGLGFMRLALASDTPIVPVAVVGAEEQAPAFADLKPLARALGMPAFPITPTFPWLGPLGLFPYPVRYRIHFGEPLRFGGNPDDEDSVLQEKVRQVQRAIARMLRDGVKSREHVFW